MELRGEDFEASDEIENMFRMTEVQNHASAPIADETTPNV